MMKKFDIYANRDDAYLMYKWICEHAPILNQYRTVAVWGPDSWNMQKIVYRLPYYGVMMLWVEFPGIIERQEWLSKQLEHILLEGMDEHDLPD